jgi:hypothetical protein
MSAHEFTGKNLLRMGLNLRLKEISSARTGEKRAPEKYLLFLELPDRVFV